MIQWPSKLGGKPKLVGWLNRLLDRCKASEIKNIIGGRLIETSDGKTLIVDPARGGGTPPTRPFPFKIHLSPPDPGLDAAGHLDKDWRTFRVRNGLVGLTGVDFTDEVANPDSSEVPDFDTDIDFLVPASKTVMVYINANGLPLEIHMDASDALPSSPIDISAWSTTTGWDDGKFILLGWIDTLSDVATKVAHVRQLIRADLPEYLQAPACIDDVVVTLRLPARIVPDP